MKRGALHMEVIMFINDLHEHCGSGRLGSSRHVRGIIDENYKKVGKGIAVFSGRIQSLGATQARNLSAGVLNPKVFLGR
jgi:hypothetical protein